MNGDDASIQVNLSDTAVAGDVNITQSLQADTEEIVEKLVNQLDRFDINKPGLAVPEDGFSRLDVEAAIPLVREDMNILKGMTSLSLFCNLENYSIRWDGQKLLKGFPKFFSKEMT